MPASPDPSGFAGWGARVYRHRLGTLLAVVIVTLLGGLWGSGVTDRLSRGGFGDPDSESARAAAVTERALGPQGEMAVVYTAPPGATVDDPSVAEAVTDTLAALPPDAVRGSVSYWSTGAPQLVNPDHTRGLAVVTLSGSDSADRLDAYERIAGRLAPPGIDIQVAGTTPVDQAVNEATAADLTRAESVSLPVVLVLLTMVFGSLVAACLPVAVGLLAIAGSLAVLRVVALGVEVNAFAVNIVTLLGLGLAIDYGLFMVGRFREELARGLSTGEAVQVTVATAGRTVAVSATLLVVALSGLLLFPQGFLKSLGYGGMAAVALAAAAALTLLPAALGMLGHRVDKLRVWRPKRGRHAVAAQGWERLARAVMRRPLLVAVSITAGLLVLSAPMFGAQFGQLDQRALPQTNPARVAADAVQRDFPGFTDNATTIVLQGATGPPAPQAVEQVIRNVAALPGVAAVAPAKAGGDVVTLSATLRDDPLAAKARRTVDDMRALPDPAATRVLVDGPTAQGADGLAAIAETLPWMAALLIGATTVMLFLAFGSVVLSVTAVLTSALSLGATFGVLVWVFSDGNGADLLGVTPAPLEAGVVILMAAIVFGLSTDYEVFLLSRMVEARTHGATTTQAVITGLARTGRVITTAALLLIVVTGAFAFSSVSTMRFIGVGMILALVLDATVVRMLLVPALLRLLGEAAWWAPRPLRKRQQRVGRHEAEPSGQETPRRPGRNRRRPALDHPHVLRPRLDRRRRYDDDRRYPAHTRQEAD